MKYFFIAREREASSPLSQRKIYFDLLFVMQYLGEMESNHSKVEENLISPRCTLKFRSIEFLVYFEAAIISL